MEGIAIGNGFLDPETLLCYGDFLYQTGLVDNNTKQEIMKLETQGKKAIHSKNYVDAFYVSVIKMRPVFKLRSNGTLLFSKL